MPAEMKIIGHQAIIQRLEQAAKNARPHHAYLFVGTPHLGKTTVARRFARQLLCEQTGPCGACTHCLLAEAGNHPDYLELPEDGKLTIEQIRNLKQSLSLKPHSAAWRVGLVPDADRLGLPAQNALLKLLEEPPAKTVLILTAGAPETLLPTTVSRCQVVTFTRPDAQTVIVGLKQLGAEAEAAVAAARSRPGLAHRLLSEPERLACYQQWREQLSEVLGAGPAGRLKTAKMIAEDENLPELLDYWLQLHQQALDRRLGLTTGEEAPDSIPSLEQLDLPDLRANLTLLVAAVRRLRYNPNVLLLLEHTTLGLAPC